MIHLQLGGKKKRPPLKDSADGGRWRCFLREATLTRQGKINQEATQTIQLSQRSIGRKDI
jgi:hypothetical protein